MSLNESKQLCITCINIIECEQKILAPVTFLLELCIYKPCVVANVTTAFSSVGWLIHLG